MGEGRKGVSFIIFQVVNVIISSLFIRLLGEDPNEQTNKQARGHVEGEQLVFLFRLNVMNDWLSTRAEKCVSENKEKCTRETGV